MKREGKGKEKEGKKRERGGERVMEGKLKSGWRGGRRKEKDKG